MRGTGPGETRPDAPLHGTVATDLRTERLVLEPLTRAHAGAMFEILRDDALYRYLDHPPPPTLEHLRAVYTRLETRQSPDARQRWLNWIVRPHGTTPIGFVQATVIAGSTAWVAYLLGRAHWGRGYAEEATRAMLDHLASTHGVTRCLASVEADNDRSLRLLERLGFHAAAPAELQGRDLSATERLYLR